MYSYLYQNIEYVRCKYKEKTLAERLTEYHKKSENFNNLNLHIPKQSTIFD